MATKQTTLIGRTVKIDFHSWEMERVQGETRAEKIASICERGQGAYRVCRDRDGQTAEIVSHSDEGYRLLFADGELGDVHEMFFSVLPKVAEKPQGWEYATFTFQDTMEDLRNLNIAGGDGWEMCAIKPPTDKFRAQAVFKRRIVSK